MTTEVDTSQAMLTLELDAEIIPLLAAIAPSYAVEKDDDTETRAREALLEICDRIRDGVTRPASWERAWLVKALGDDWLGQLEPDPDAPHHRQRPKPRAKTPVPPTGQETQGGGS